ncbi:MHYT domain-containing protein [Gloeocapsa sp. BRSZ]
MISDTDVLLSHHDLGLVFLSIAIAIVASYTALSLSGRVTVAVGRIRKLWLSGGAIAMGIGIWAMHFIAMLAYNLPVAIHYDLPLVFLSMGVAIVASGIALLVVSREFGLPQLIAGGGVMGLSIAAMHYTGMAAMRLAATPEYDPKLVVLSLAIAIGASLVALQLAFRLQKATTAQGQWQVGGAIVMGFAIAGMHYTAMAAVSFRHNQQLLKNPAPAIDNTLLGIAIAIATLVVLMLALVSSTFDQRLLAETARAEALRQSEERFRSLVQNASDIIAVIAADGRVNYTSASIKRILGYEPDAWQHTFDFVLQEDQAIAAALLDKAKNHPNVNISAEFRLRTARGQVRDFEVIVNNLLHDPAVAGIVTTYRDITERIQAAKFQLQQTERELLVAEITRRIRQSLDLTTILNTTVAEVRQFLQTERVFIYRFEPDWSGIVVVESVAPEWNSIAGKNIKDTFFSHPGNRELYRQGRIQVVDDIYTARLNPCHADLLAQLEVRANLVVSILKEEQLWGLLVANHCSQPRQWQLIEINLLQQLATQLAIAIQQSELYQQAQTELAERKRAEAEISYLNADLQNRAAELETANKELEAFSYSVSHDLRAPLRAINGFSRILLKDCIAQLTPEAQRYLLLVQANAQQMGCLIDDLLTFSRLSRAPLKKQRVEPSAIVRQVLIDLAEEQKNRHVEITIEALAACEADPALMKQVWMNLLSNALKYTHKNTAAHITIGCQQDNMGHHVYFVKDNGVGFDMQYAHKLFGVFQRLHRAEEYEGTGVGLAIVQRLIHRHGGRVWAEAQVDRGATFYFTL